MLLHAAAAAFICPGLGRGWRLGLACWGRPLLHRPRPFNSWTRPLRQRARPLLQSPRPLLHSPRPLLHSPRPLLQSPRPPLQSPRPLLQSPRPLLQSPRPLLQSPRPLLQSPRPLLHSPRPFHQKPRPDAGSTWRGKNLEASLWRSVDLNVPRDVVIFERNNGRLPRLLALFACGQAVFWGYLAHFSFGALTSSSELWRYGFSMFCLTVGVMIVLGSVLFSSRYVQRVVLLRGGRALTFRTAAPLLGPLGPARAFEVAVDSVSCPIAVSSATALLPVRVRGRRFYYLIDKHGSVPNRSLFNATLGTFRSF